MMVPLNKHFTSPFFILFNTESAFEKHYKYHNLAFPVLKVYCHYYIMHMLQLLLIYLITVKCMELDRWSYDHPHFHVICSHIYTHL